jgi:hypothetical protein
MARLVACSPGLKIEDSVREAAIEWRRRYASSRSKDRTVPPGLADTSAVVAAATAAATAVDNGVSYRKRSRSRTNQQQQSRLVSDLSITSNVTDAIHAGRSCSEVLAALPDRRKGKHLCTCLCVHSLIAVSQPIRFLVPSPVYCLARMVLQPMFIRKEMIDYNTVDSMQSCHLSGNLRYGVCLSARFLVADVFYRILVATRTGNIRGRNLLSREEFL